MHAGAGSTGELLMAVEAVLGLGRAGRLGRHALGGGVDCRHDDDDPRWRAHGSPRTYVVFGYVISRLPALPTTNRHHLMPTTSEGQPSVHLLSTVQYC